VVGVADEQWGETPAAYLHVSSLSAVDTADLEKWVDDRLARFKRPRHVYVSEDPIPRASKDAKVARGEIKVLVRGWVADASTLPTNVVKAGHHG
jgi:acyl-CoA synthetase (AMP-forming)/AMP-acid ligase II